MIIIADAHVDEVVGNDADFFRMLHSFERNHHDVVFLGDIFDLWIALPRYEKDIHQKFLSWCREQKRHRSIGFIEGNHEYFVAQEKQDYFSWCSDSAIWQDDRGNLFCHGDQINRRDKNYLRFRKLSKNKIMKSIVRYLPFGPQIGELLKIKLKKTNLEFRKKLPKDEITRFADDRFSDGVHAIFVAHFHQDYLYRNSETNALYILPGWFQSKHVTVYDMESKQVTSHHWQELKQGT